jgi:hypothetical protein
MSEVQKAVRTALVAAVAASGALLLESVYIADPDLRYPIVLLTKVLGAIVVIILIIRVAWTIAKKKVQTVAPHAEGGLRNLGAVLVVTAASLGGCIFGVSLMRGQSGSIEYWPLSIVLIFGGLAVYGLRYLWREWRMYRRLRSEQRRA